MLWKWGRKVFLGHQRWAGAGSQSYLTEAPKRPLCSQPASRASAPQAGRSHCLLLFLSWFLPLRHLDPSSGFHSPVPGPGSLWHFLEDPVIPRVGGKARGQSESRRGNIPGWRKGPGLPPPSIQQGPQQNLSGSKGKVQRPARARPRAGAAPSAALPQLSGGGGGGGRHLPPPPRLTGAQLPGRAVPAWEPGRCRNRNHH